ncbi:MAG: hypothetical protein JNL01_06770 [Bdellovibrionales bacterium]|nr:hypothetical protein [Bdellovibrionales bacterium]
MNLIRFPAVLVFFAWSTLALVPSSAWAKKVFTVKDCTFDALIKYSEGGTNSTTSLRKESKWIVKQEHQEQFLNELKKDYDGKIKLRDVPAEGTRNVTTTDYAVEVRIPSGKKGVPDRHAKLRVRSYGSRLDGTKDPIELADAFKDKAKVELKIDHPTLEDVVYKPGITMKRKDIDLLLGGYESYKANISKVRASTKALEENKGQDGLVDKMFESIESLYEQRAAALGKNAPKKLYNNANIQYERDAYRIEMKDLRSNPPKKVDVQITIDRSVEFRNPKNPYEVLASYPDDYRAIEIKVPVEYENMSLEELKNAVPELYELKKKYALLKQVSDVPAGKGKAGTLGQLLDEKKSWTEKVSEKFQKNAVGRFVVDRALKTYTSHALVWIPVGIYLYATTDHSKADTANIWAKVNPVYQDAETGLHALADRIAVSSEQALPVSKALDQFLKAADGVQKTAGSSNLTERKEYQNFVASVNASLERTYLMRKSAYFELISNIQSLEVTQPKLATNAKSSAEFKGTERAYVRDALRFHLARTNGSTAVSVIRDQIMKDLAGITDQMMIRRELEDAIRESAGFIGDLRRELASE